MFVITGMHRSGTSIVARLFRDIGSDMGDARGFYAADRWNPDGYFEQQKIHSINFPLVHGSWGRVSYFRLPSTTAIVSRAARIEAEIKSVAREFDGKVVKDPRFCLTLPAWSTYGADVRGVVICLRNPHSVASSIRRRNRIPLWFAYRLWLTHMSRLEASVGRLPVHYVRYERLLDPATFADEVRFATRCVGIDPSDPALDRLYLTVVKRDMNHHPRVSEALPPPVEELWSCLSSRQMKHFDDWRFAQSEAHR